MAHASNDSGHGLGGGSAHGALASACTAGAALRAYVLVNGVAIALALVGPPHGWATALLHALAVAEPATGLWIGALFLARAPLRKAGPAWQAATAIAAAAGAGWVADLLVASVGAQTPGWRAAALGASLAALFVRDLQLRARALGRSMTQARLDELQARIRPHFLFNALNAASALVHDQPERAESVLDDLAILFRATVSRTGTLSLVRDEVDLARRYLDIERVRFGARLQVNWQVDADVEAAQMPSLTLQPLVENAVLHGVESLPGACHLDIAIARVAGMLEVAVTNDFRPRASSVTRGTGVALTNITQRLRLLYDISADIAHGPIGGDAHGEAQRYRVRIRLPR